MRPVPGLCVSARTLLAFGIAAAWHAAPVMATRIEASDLPSGATLTILADPVEVASMDLGTFADAVAGQSLRPGDVVRTGSSGMALLTFFDGSESQLSSDSEVQIEQADYTPAPQIALLQTGGVTVNRVIPLPPGGSFRTDTPEATGLVRGTSYVVSVGSEESPTVTSVVLLTDRDGHVGHVQVVAPTSAPTAMDTVDLVQAGDVGAALHRATSASHLDGDALARLEQGARDLRDVSGALQAHAQARQVQRSMTPREPVAVRPPVSRDDDAEHADATPVVLAAHDHREATPAPVVHEPPVSDETVTPSRTSPTPVKREWPITGPTRPAAAKPATPSPQNRPSSTRATPSAAAAKPRQTGEQG